MVDINSRFNAHYRKDIAGIVLARVRAVKTVESIVKLP